MMIISALIAFILAVQNIGSTNILVGNGGLGNMFLGMIESSQAFVLTTKDFVIIQGLYFLFLACEN